MQKMSYCNSFHAYHYNQNWRKYHHAKQNCIFSDIHLNFSYNIIILNKENPKKTWFWKSTLMGYKHPQNDDSELATTSSQEHFN